MSLNHHQIDATLFALRSPLSSGVLLADEVGLGKTIEAAIVIAESTGRNSNKQDITRFICFTTRNQWLSELDEKFYIKSCLYWKANYNQMKCAGCIHPFEVKDKIVICSYRTSKNGRQVHQFKWDLVW